MCYLLYSCDQCGLEFAKDFCKEDGSIDWEKLVRLVQTDLRYSLTVLLNQVHGDV